MPKTLRAFVALPLPVGCIDLLADLQQMLKAEGLKLSWVPPRNLHLTMKFLGDIQEAAAPGVVETLQQAAARHAPLNLVLQGIGVFPGIKRPRVLWVGLGGDTGALSDLHADLDAGLARLGFAREKRVFKAHVTLARIRRPVNPQRLAQVLEEAGQYAPRDFTARRLLLIKSDLTPGGAVYSALAEAVLT